MTRKSRKMTKTSTKTLRKATKKAETQEESGDGQERVVSALVRALIRLASSSLRDLAHSLVTGNGKGDVATVTTSLKAVASQIKSPIASRSELPEEIRQASVSMLNDADLARAKSMKEQGLSYAQISAEFASDQHILYQQLTGKIERKTRALAKAPKAEKETKGESKKRPSGRAKKVTESKGEESAPSVAPAPVAEGGADW